MSLFEHFFKILRLQSEARIRIRIRIKVNGRIRIRIKVTSRIRIRINVLRIGNTNFYAYRFKELLKTYRTASLFYVLFLNILSLILYTLEE
jgi:hypothetical protein